MWQVTENKKHLFWGSEMTTEQIHLSGFISFDAQDLWRREPWRPNFDSLNSDAFTDRNNLVKLAIQVT